VKYIKYVLIFLLSIILLIVVSGVVLAYFYEDEVKNLVVSKLNQNLLTEISVDDINFSVLRKFPNASLEFKNVCIKSSTGINKKDFDINVDTLCFAEKLFLEFNIRDIFNKQYNIQKVNLENGKINILIDKSGNENYLFWEKKSNSGESNLDLKKVELNEVKLHHINRIKELNYSTFIKAAELSGNLSQDVFDLTLDVQTINNFLEIEKISYLENRKLSAEITLGVDSINTVIHKGNINLSGIKFSINGNFGDELNLDIKGQDINIKSFLSLLPRSLISEIDDFKSEGLFYIDCNISGKVDKRNSPHIKASFGIEKAEVRYISEGIDLKNVNLQGVYTNGSSNSSETASLKIKNISAQYNASSFSGEYTLENFINPRIIINLKTEADLNDIKQLINSDTIEVFNGKIQAEFKYQGFQKKINELTESDFKYAQTQGFVKLYNANLKLVESGLNYSNVNGKFSFENADIFIDSMNVTLDKSDFLLKGWVKNIFPYILFENEILAINANVTAENIDIDYFIKAFASNESSESSQELLPNVIIDTYLKSNKIGYEKFVATSVKGNLHYNSNKIIANNLSFNSMKGSVKGEALFTKLETENYLLKSKAELKNIDITNLFQTFDNFSQNFILAQNLKGDISGNLNISAEWNTNLEVIEKSIMAESSITIVDGELLDFEPMTQLSKYIELDDLKRIKFSKLENDIFIKDRVITIPAMDIFSSAFNILASGTHNFDNEFDYSVKVLMSDILAKKAKKAKKENEEFGVIEDDGLGKTSIYLRISGTPDNYNVVYDSRKVKEHIKESIKEEKNNLKKILNEEFGWFKKDSSIIKNKKDTTNIFDRKYNIIWEEGKEETETSED